MSRHRHEARLYVTAGPEFLDQARLPLAHAEEVAQRVADGFRNRHTKQLAMLQGEIAENDYRARQWERERAATPWWRREQRRALQERVGHAHDVRDRWLEDVRKLLEPAPAPGSQPRRARDLLSAAPPQLDTPARATPGRGLADDGLDLGP